VIVLCLPIQVVLVLIHAYSIHTTHPWYCSPNMLEEFRYNLCSTQSSCLLIWMIFANMTGSLTHPTGPSGFDLLGQRGATVPHCTIPTLCGEDGPQSDLLPPGPKKSRVATVTYARRGIARRHASTVLE